MKEHKTRIVPPDSADPTDNIIHLPDGTVAFTQKGYDRWKPRFAKIGVDIDKPIKSEDICDLMMLTSAVDPHRHPAEAALLAIFQDDPVKKAEYEKEAEPWIRRVDRMAQRGIRVIPADRLRGRQCS